MPPERIVDVLALVGDSVDNVPGVPGIGDKGARDLVREFGPVESGPRARRRGEARGLPRGAQEPPRRTPSSRSSSSRCAPTPPSSWTSRRCRRQEPDRAAAHALFKELEFQALAREYAPEVAETAAAEHRLLTTRPEIEAVVAEARQAEQGRARRRGDEPPGDAGPGPRDRPRLGARPLRVRAPRALGDRRPAGPGPRGGARGASPAARGRDGPQGERPREAGPGRPRAPRRAGRPPRLRRPRRLLPPRPRPAGLRPRGPRDGARSASAARPAPTASPPPRRRPSPPARPRAGRPSSSCASTGR